MDVSGSLDVPYLITATKALDLTTVRDALSWTDKTTISDGTGANQADLIWHDQRTLASGANEELDLAGSLSDAFGDTVTFAKIKAMLITNPDTASTLKVGGAASNAWATWVANSTDIIVIRPGGRFYIEAPDANGYAVTAGTGDKLKILHGAESSIAINYKIAILGIST